MRISDWSSDVCSSDLLLALVLTATSAVNFAVGQPYTRYIYCALVHDVSEAAANVYLQERTFLEVKGVTFMAERIWRDSHEFSGVFIHKEDEFGGGDRKSTSELQSQMRYSYAVFGLKKKINK